MPNLPNPGRLFNDFERCFGGAGQINYSALQQFRADLHKQPPEVRQVLLAYIRQEWKESAAQDPNNAYRYARFEQVLISPHRPTAEELLARFDAITKNEVASATAKADLEKLRQDVKALGSYKGMVGDYVREQFSYHAEGIEERKLLLQRFTEFLDKPDDLQLRPSAVELFRTFERSNNHNNPTLGLREFGRFRQQCQALEPEYLKEVIAHIDQKWHEYAKDDPRKLQRIRSFRDSIQMMAHSPEAQAA